MKNGLTANSIFVCGLIAMYPLLCARTESTARFCAVLSASERPCVGAALRSAKMFARFTTAACSGCASGTLMISMRMSDVAAFERVVSARHPGSSLDDRSGADPET